MHIAPVQSGSRHSAALFLNFYLGIEDLLVHFHIITTAKELELGHSRKVIHKVRKDLEITLMILEEVGTHLWAKKFLGG